MTLASQRSRLETVAATDEVVRQIDRAQYETGQGPCLTSLWEHESVRVDDMASDVLWPEFSARARGYGIRSMVGFRLFLLDDTMGALNLFATRPSVFDDASDDVARLFAAHAAIALGAARQIDRLETALLTRDVIGQAKGILMERLKIDGVGAFQTLVTLSQRMNRKLHDVAATVVASTETRARENAAGRSLQS